MVFRWSDSARLLVAFATMGIVLPSLAQRQGQAIIFSTPDSEMATNLAPSLTPRRVEMPELLSGLRAPMIPTPPSLQPPPAPVQMMTPAQSASAQQELDRQKNWTLLTPAEILGVPTLESTMGVSERNAAGEKKNQTALERYFDRRQRDEKMAMTNQAASINQTPDWSLQGRRQPELNPGFSTTRNNSFYGTPDNPANANQEGVTAWTKSFTSQTISPPVQTPEQMAAAQAAAEDFQKLLQPRMATLSRNTPSTVSASTTPNSIFAPPAPSAGTSFTPVSSGVITPQGVTPLLGPTSVKNPSTTPVTPEWKRKLPPWMSSPANQNF
jgi:hypothetical protein